MSRSIYQRIWGAFQTNRRRKARCRTRSSGSRRLAMESLESRKLMTATTLTLNSISDASFAAPALVAKSYQIAPASCPWQFSGIAGVSANNSAFTLGNPNAPDGTQVAFLKDTGSMIQTVSLDAGVYNLSFLAAERVNYQTQNQEIEVLIDGKEVGEVVPAGTTYASYQTSNFTVTAGTHNVEFLGVSPATADSTAFVGEVTIAPVVDSIVDGGFEGVTLAANTYQTDPTGLAWQFSGTSGVAGNGSALVANSSAVQNAPAGTQVGYIQDNGSISQTVYLDAGAYQLSFLAAQCAINQTNYEEIDVLVDPNTPNVQNVGTIEPLNTSYASYQTSTFTETTTGAHTIEFLGLNPLGGNDTALIDQATISTANTISNSSFETPALTAGQYQFAPTGSSWQFSGGGGIASNASNFTSGNPDAPNGTQVAIIEGNGSMSQSVDLIAGSYNIAFQAAQCAANAVTQGQQIAVLVDGARVGLITPVGITYSLYETSNFLVRPKHTPSSSLA